MLGYANKGHYGFLGHSVLGRWVNFGAGTTTSNLKSTYGDVRLDVAGARVETGHQFLGRLIGDHAKTAIGTLPDARPGTRAGPRLFGGGRGPPEMSPVARGRTAPGR